MQKKSLIIGLTILLAVLLGLGMRLRTADMLPIDYDEDDYLSAAQHYSAAIQSGSIADVVNYTYNYEHPPLTKIIYGIAFSFFPPTDPIAQLTPDKPPAASLPNPQFIIARLISVLLGTLEVLVVGLISPVAGLLLAVHTWTIKYTSQVMLEPLPAFFSILCVDFYIRSKKQVNGWFLASAVILGMTAASKYTYCVAGLAILVDQLWFTREKIKTGSKLGWIKWISPVLLMGFISLTFFWVANPRLWTTPITRLGESIFYHAGYASSDYVKQAGFPTWQPLIWLTESVPWHPGVFPITLDFVITLFAALGIKRQWKKQSVVVIWLLLAIAVLLLWPTKWPQYILILTAPLCIISAEGFFRAYSRLMILIKKFQLPSLKVTKKERQNLVQALPWLIPGCAILAVITAFPLIFQFAMSFTDISNNAILDGLRGGVWREFWLGITGQVQALEVDLFGNPSHSKLVHFVGPNLLLQIIGGEGSSILVFEVIWTGLSITTQAALGILVALVLNNKHIPWKNFWRSILILPWAIPEFVGALMWSQILDPGYGWNAILAKMINMPEAAFASWQNNPDMALLYLLIANLWYGFPMMMLAASAGLKGISAEVFEAAAMDGASRWSLFRKITFPLLLPLMFPVIVLRTIQIFNQFYLFYVMNPPFPILTLSVISYSSFRQGYYAISAAINVITVLILLILIIYINRKARLIEGAAHGL